MSFGFGLALPYLQNALSAALDLVFNTPGQTTISPLITFTRASAANYFGSDGLLKSAGVNVPVLEYDPATLLTKGLRIEAAATNLLTAPRDGTNAAWSKTDTTPTLNQIGLDGTANSATLYTEGSAGTAAVGQVGSAVTAGSTITASRFIKRGNTDWVVLQCGDNTGSNGARAWFNLTTGVVGTVANQGTGTAGTGKITAVSGGYWKIEVSSIPSGSYTLPYSQTQSANADNTNTRVSGATYIVDYAQLETGAVATSPIIGTRAADVAVVSGTNFSSWFNATQGTFVVEFSAIGTSISPVHRGIIGLGSQARYGYIGSGTSAVKCFDGALEVSSNGASVIDGAAHIFCVAYQAGRAITNNGAIPATGTQAGAFTVGTSLNIGTYDGSSLALNGYIRRITYYPTRLPNATLQALST